VLILARIRSILKLSTTYCYIDIYIYIFFLFAGGVGTIDVALFFYLLVELEFFVEMSASAQLCKNTRLIYYIFFLFAFGEELVVEFGDWVCLESFGGESCDEKAVDGLDA